MKQDYRKYYYLIPTWLWIISITLLTYFCASHRLDSDMSAELVLAKWLASEHKLLTTEWFYSTELRLLNTQLLAMPLFLIFDSFRLVRTLQCFFLQILLLWSYLYCMKKMKVKDAFRYLSSMFLFVPFSMTFVDIVHIGNFYIPHYIFLFVMIGFTISFLEHPNIYRRIGYLMLSLLCGLSSVRYLLMIQLPLLAACLLVLYREAAQSGESVLSRRTFRNPLFWNPVIGLFLAGVGYVANEKLLHRFFSFRSNTGVPFTNLAKSNLMSRLGEKVSDIFRLFGYWDGHKVMSLSGICSLFAIGSVFLIVCMVCLLLKRRNQLNRYQYLVVLMFVMSFLMATFVYLFSDGFYQARYYITSLILFVPVLGIFLEQGCLWKKDLFALTAGALSCMLLFNGTCMVYWTVRYDENLSIKAVCEFLRQEELTHGYASFWNGAILTELSDGEVKVVNIKDFSTMQPDRWLMPKKYAQRDILENTAHNRVFFLLTAQEYEQYSECEFLRQKECVYDQDGYKVFAGY